MLNSHFCDLNQLVRAHELLLCSLQQLYWSKCAPLYYIRASCKRWASWEWDNQILHHFIAGVLPASLFLSSFHLLRNPRFCPANRLCEKRRKPHDSFFRYYGSEERPWACTRSEWSPDRRWHDVTSPGRPGFPSHVSDIKAEGVSVNCAHNSRSIIREVSRYTPLLFSARTQLTSDFQVFLSIQVEEINSALLSVFHSSFRM